MGLKLLKENSIRREKIERFGAKHRLCWRTCAACRRPWGKVSGTFVHQVMDNTGRTKFICDACLKKLHECS